MSIDGILNINKPEGITSFGVVASLKRITREKRVGHAGTLDSHASGVLPVFLGQGTRLVQFLMTATKDYRAVVKLGVTTNTYDLPGEVTKLGDTSEITKDQVEDVLYRFVGETMQTPPLYSALKYGGKRFSDLARAGITVTLTPRPVRIESIKLLTWSPPSFTIDVKCGKGTYIRSLAHDVGQLLGCGACLSSLVRLRYGPFQIEKASSLERIEAVASAGALSELLYPLDFVLQDWPAFIVTEEQEDCLKYGRELVLEPAIPFSNTARAYGPDGRFVAILRLVNTSGVWHPFRVFYR